ncbi:MAG TPA: Stp1/IreP family PP2C-type Ser/Thr phosphatase [Acidobacteriaceae bacterium]|jgi:PPM family protein phosphatase|nr:Stp1/IreP family PP2C-type Ser/Thr phosphatase [Acidobacteriaceae bacterium]
MGKTPPIRAFGLSDVGCVRELNEDSFGLRSEDGVYVVCDGMGGGAAGEVASSLAVDSFLSQLGKSKLERHPAADDVTEALRLAIQHANSLVLQRSRLSAEFRGMGTTLVALWLRRAQIDGATQRAAWVAHAGDSRCYRFRDGELSALTTDHSLVEQQVRMGQITPEEAEQSTMRHVITRAVGVDPELDPEIAVTDAQPGDLYLLCSDGLTTEVTNARIAEVLRHDKQMENACRTLVAEARSHGGRDNITCVLAQAE